jgi:hypothetical protein
MKSGKSGNLGFIAEKTEQKKFVCGISSSRLLQQPLTFTVLAFDTTLLNSLRTSQL